MHEQLEWDNKVSLSRIQPLKCSNVKSFERKLFSYIVMWAYKIPSSNKKYYFSQSIYLS